MPVVRAKTELPQKLSSETPVRRMLSVREAAESLGVSKSYLDKSRITGDGPPFHKIGRPVTAGRSYRSPQNAATPINQRDLSESQSEKLSFGQEQKQKPDPSKQERLPEELTRLVRLWNRACLEQGKATLAWQPSDVTHWSAKLIELIQVLRLSESSEEDLLKRLRLLAGHLERFSGMMGPRFEEYNRHGLTVGGFALYGQTLWQAAEAELKEEAANAKKKVSYFFSDSGKAGKPAE
jgi:hypothetical protein